MFGAIGRVPGNQAVEIVTVGTIGAERLFIKKALDSASETDLVRVLLVADGPAHLAMPTAAEH